MRINQNSKYYLTSRNYLLERYRKNVTHFLVIIVFMFSILFPLLIFYNYSKTELIEGLVSKVDNNYIVKIYIKKDNLDIIKHKRIIYDNKNIPLKITSISEDLELSNKGLYKEVVIDLKLNETDQINNNLIKLNIVYGKTTIFKELVNIIRKE